MRVDGWYGCCRLVCNRWCMCSICFSDLVHFADWSLGCFCPAADRHLIKTSCIKPFRVLLNSFIPLLQPRYNPKIFHNSSKHFTEQLIPFSCTHSFLSDVNARYIRFGSNSARGPPLLKTCVGSDLFVHEHIHHPQEGQQPQRQSALCGKILYSQPQPEQDGTYFGVNEMLH